jgi:hypothetical protein
MLVEEIKAELKKLKVKGITGKKKPELMAMLEEAKKKIEPVAPVRQTKLKKPAPAPEPPKMEETKPVRIIKLKKKPVEAPAPLLKELPPKLRKQITNDLIASYNTHEYKNGFGYESDDVKQYIDKLIYKALYKNLYDNSPDAVSYLRKLKEYVDKKSFDVTFAGEKQKAILVNDFEKIFE